MPMEDLLTRQAPHSQEAEQSVLGSMLIDARCVPEVIEALRPEDFYLRTNRENYETVYSMFNFSLTIDPVTVLENMKIGAYLRHDKLDDDIEWCYELFPRLKERHWQLAGTLSGGEQQMLAVARALMSRPKLMMMDEPSLGLAPLIVRDIFQIIREINKQGVTILLIEQNANMALHTADRGYVMETGEIILEGAGRELLENPVIREAYLGK